MAYTDERLKISEAIYPLIIGNQITILSSVSMQESALALFSSFQCTVWIAILMFFTLCLALNTIQTYLDQKKNKIPFYIPEIIISLVLDHFLALIGKR